MTRTIGEQQVMAEMVQQVQKQEEVMPVRAWRKPAARCSVDRTWAARGDIEERQSSNRKEERKRWKQGAKEGEKQAWAVLEQREDAQARQQEEKGGRAQREPRRDEDCLPPLEQQSWLDG